MKENTNFFYSLTPLNNIELGGYKSALDFVFANDEIKNIAISGPYDAGKSSILETYKKATSCKKKFLHLSLSHFRASDNNSISDKGTVTTESLLEGKILNQLIHKISPEKIPLTNFRIKKDISVIKNMFRAGGIFLFISLGFYITFFIKWVCYIDSISLSFFGKMLSFTTYDNSRIIAGIIVCGLVFYSFFKLFNILSGRQIIKKAGIKGIDIEVFSDKCESYFDKYLHRTHPKLEISHQIFLLMFCYPCS